jgi:hypothetical protein
MDGMFLTPLLPFLPFFPLSLCNFWPEPPGDYQPLNQESVAVLGHPPPLSLARKLPVADTPPPRSVAPSLKSGAYRWPQPQQVISGTKEHNVKLHGPSPFPLTQCTCC